MSACDSCFHPGACCKRMVIHLVAGEGDEPEPRWGEEDTVRARAEQTAYMKRRGLPYRPLGLQETQHGDKVWVFSCPKLDAESGRCTIYAHRPNICRSYEPCTDGLCVHFQPLEGGDASADP